MRNILLLLTLAVGLAGCNRRGNSTKLDYQMGEKVPNGPLVYNVVETSWRNQLGEGFKVRTPQNRYLLISLSVTNGGGEEVALPLFTIEDGNGKTYQELQDGQGVPTWFGLLRNVAPAQTQQGNLVFDVPLSSYTIRLPNGAAPGEERFVSVQIPLRIDTDISVQGPSIAEPLTGAKGNLK